MNHFARFVIHVYSRTLGLYPRRFRDEFAVEMNMVFGDRIAEAAEEGIRSLIVVCGREFMSMPFNILREYWHEFHGEQTALHVAPFSPLKKGTWGESFWAGLPHLLFAIFVSTSRAMINPKSAAISGMILALLLLAGLLVTIYYTWRDHWPAWSASWYGYAALIAVFYAIQPLEIWIYPPDETFGGVGTLILLLLGLVALLYWLTRRNPIEGLLMGMPLIILYWLPYMEFVPNQISFWLEFGIFALSALTATTITRLNDIQKAVWLVLGASVLSGLVMAYAGTYWQNIPAGDFSPPAFGEMVELFSGSWLTSGALVLGPILAWGVWFLGKKQGKIGRVGALFIVSGWISSLIGNLSYWWMTGYFSSWWQSGNQTSLNASQILTVYQWTLRSATFVVLAGLVMILVGAISLDARLWSQSKLLSITLILVPLALPLILFPTYVGDHIVPARFSFEFVRLADTYRYLIFLLGAVWLVISGWTVTRLYHPLVDKETA